MAIQKAPQWAIYLYDSITYLRVLADPTSRPRPQTNDASKPQRTRPKKPPASPSILTISSWKANLAAAVWRDCQRGILPGGSCVEQTSAPSASKSAEKVSRGASRDFYKVVWLRWFSYSVARGALGHFQSFFFFFFLILAFVRKREKCEGRELIWDAVGSLVATA